MAASRPRLHQVLGYEPTKLSVRVKRAIWSVLLAIPCAVIATGMSDSTAVPNAIRYVFSPGTMLAIRIISVEPSHRGAGVFIDALNWYAAIGLFALFLNAVFYTLLIFGLVTTISTIEAATARK